ncbi:hypothetical protein GGX14DRAFT_561479 [Mycena pura]|uniref:Uncharacterized protein n=1 Tax=Mycena pura TaxID=153505 RepID=A0AAD6YGA0_9AGAR|nr:hypothetical protein GGX14DRAFT_561479 [Mycena pura]
MEHVAARAANLDVAEQIRRQIERNEEERRALLVRQAQLHSSRGIRVPTPAVVQPATSEVVPTKHGRGRPPKSNKPPKVVNPPKVKTLQAPKTLKSVEPEQTPSWDEVDEDEGEELNDEDDSDKELEGNKSAEKTESAKTPKHRALKRRVAKPRRSEVDCEDFVIRRPRGTVQRAEFNELDASYRNMAYDLEVMNQCLDYTYWAIVDLLKNIDNEDVESRKGLFSRMLGILAGLAPVNRNEETPEIEEPPKKRRRVEEDNHRESPDIPEMNVDLVAAEAGIAPEDKDVDVEMGRSSGEMVQAMQNVESAQEVEQIAKRVPSVERNAGEITEVDASAEEIVEESPNVEGNTEAITEQAPNVERTAEHAPLVLIPPPVIPEVTPKVEEMPIIEGPAGVPAGPGMVWVQMPAPDWVVKTEDAPAAILIPIQVPRNGPADRPEDAIEIDDDDDDEITVDPPAVEKSGNSEEVNESGEMPK